jgi:hypothetical protein
MKKLLLSLALTCALGLAAPVLTLENTHQSAPPGQTVSWNFTLTSDNDFWISVVSSFLEFETNPSLGSYTDNIAFLGGPVDFSLAPEANDWTDVLGSFLINPFALPGSLNEAEVVVLIEYFSGNPLTCGDCYVSAGELRSAISVGVSDVPEPATVALTGATLLAALIAKRKRR